ncbi:MAG: hypothetical protein LBS49_03515 [Candidatus Accumulibacter sp.]|jgi:hypothetical protein|nr:hypothetical protein [Accumulibacter sp.]
MATCFRVDKACKSIPFPLPITPQGQLRHDPREMTPIAPCAAMRGDARHGQPGQGGGVLLKSHRDHARADIPVDSL